MSADQDHDSQIGPPLPPGSVSASLPERRVLEALICPVTKSTLIYDAERKELISRAARLAYPIIDGMPVMVVSEARVLDDDDPILRR